MSKRTMSVTQAFKLHSTHQLRELISEVVGRALDSGDYSDGEGLLEGALLSVIDINATPLTTVELIAFGDGYVDFGAEDVGRFRVSTKRGREGRLLISSGSGRCFTRCSRRIGNALAAAWASSSPVMNPAEIKRLNEQARLTMLTTEVNL